MVCPNCGAQLPDPQQPCPSCGQRLVPPPIPKRATPKWIWVLAGCALVPVVLAVLGIVAAIVVPNLLDAQQKAKQTRALADLSAIGQAVEAYKAQHGSVPEANDLDALANQLGTAASGLARLDPWQHAYRYACWRESAAAGCDHYRIVSAGRDGKFEQDDVQSYVPGTLGPHEYDRDLVYGDGTVLVAPAAR
jgi:type II secretory pathway pseudopilin PulG